MLPQYHVVFDNSLTTINYLRQETFPGNWKDILDNHTELVAYYEFKISKICHLIKSTAQLFPIVGMGRQ